MAQHRYERYAHGRGRLVAAVTALTVLGLSIAAASSAGLFSSADLPPVKQALLQKIEPPTNSTISGGAKSLGAKTVPLSTIQPPEHAGEIGTPDQLGGVPLPFPSSVFDVSNMWQNLQSGVFISLYAGSLGSNPNQGAIIVERISGETGRDLPGSGEFLTPSPSGPVTLTNVQGNVASFSDGSGTGSFDIVSDTYSP